MPNSQRRPFVELDAWKEDARQQKASAEVALCKSFAGVFKAEGDGADAPIRIRITTTQRDRSHDTVNPSGWRLDNYVKNPVVLWAHDYRSFPIAKDTGLTIDANGLVGTPQFATADENPWAPYCERLIRGGFLNAASVGFVPLKWMYNEEERGVDFEEQELLEYSIVPVPDNPGALVEAKRAGIEIGWIAEWAEKALDEWHGASGLWVPRQAVEEARVIAGRKGLVMLVPKAVGPASAERKGADASVEVAPIVGARVKVKRGRAHDAMTVEAVGTIREVMTEALGVEFDGMAAVHRWYIADELELAADDAKGSASSDDDMGDMPMDERKAQSEKAVAAAASTDTHTDSRKDGENADTNADTASEHVLELDDAGSAEDEVLELEDDSKTIDIDEAELRELVRSTLKDSLGPALTALTGRID